MGMYTEVLVKTSLREDLPKETLAVLDYMFGHKHGAQPEVLPDHPFFQLPRWDAIGKCSSYYHHPQAVNSIVKCESGWYIFSRSDFKNYSGEVEAFFDWFAPLTDVPEGQCIGYSWYEEDKIPTLIIKQADKEEK